MSSLLYICCVRLLSIISRQRLLYHGLTVLSLNSVEIVLYECAVTITFCWAYARQHQRSTERDINIVITWLEHRVYCSIPRCALGLSIADHDISPPCQMSNLLLSLSGVPSKIAAWGSDLKVPVLEKKFYIRQNIWWLLLFVTFFSQLLLNFNFHT